MINNIKMMYWYDIDGKLYSKRDLLKKLIEKEGCCAGLSCKQCPIKSFCHGIKMDKLSMFKMRDIKLEECRKQLACILVDEELKR